MPTSVIVLIVTLAMPNGDASVEVKPMESAQICRTAAELVVADPFVSSVECSELVDGKLQLEFRPRELDTRQVPATDNPRATG